MSKYKKLIFTLLIVLLIIGFGFYKITQINKYGVFTVARVLKYESAASGGDLYIEIYFQGKVINATVGNACAKCIGKYYFVKVLKETPSKHVIFFNESPVPDCILRNGIPKDGWKEFPICT